MQTSLAHTLQGTIRQAVSFKGRGLHTGKYSQITIFPSDENTGIIFQRVDKLGENTQVLAHWKNTKKLPLCTCIASPENGIHVRTIEHLMAAFYACGVDNARVEVNGSELPIMDGSSEPFVRQINLAGVKQQTITRSICKVDRLFEIKEGDRLLRIEPADSLSIDVTITLKKIGRLNWKGEINPTIFSEEIGRARTFGRLKSGLMAQFTRFSKDPICLGANTSSAIVIAEGDKVLNKGGLRFSDEYVRHRLLDLVGDLMLSGGYVQGKITAISPAHRMTHDLLSQICK